jgi:DNA modification methylase
MIRVLHGDCRVMMLSLDEASVDAIVTDPPYELGFMGKGWDKSGIAYDSTVWQECLRVLKPGGHLLAFSGTRTYHRMVCAIEDAGFEVRDQIGWLYGSGFPKSHNGPWGGTALKPAWEPICMARKPLTGTVEANWREHGTGALNIDGCRVEVPDGDVLVEFDRAPGDVSRENWRKGTCVGAGKPVERGRWPANVIHDGSDEVVAAFPQAPGQQGDLTGHSKDRLSKGIFGDMKSARDALARGDTGSAARFFYCAKADRADRNEGLDGMPERPSYMVENGSKTSGLDGERYERKTTTRNHHPTVKPTDLMRYLCRLVTPKGGTVLDPFMGSGSTLKAAELEGFSAIGIELDAEYIEIAKRRIAADAPLFAEVL